MFFFVLGAFIRKSENSAWFSIPLIFQKSSHLRASASEMGANQQKNKLMVHHLKKRRRNTCTCRTLWMWGGQAARNYRVAEAALNDLRRRLLGSRQKSWDAASIPGSAEDAEQVQAKSVIDYRVLATHWPSATLEARSGTVLRRKKSNAPKGSKKKSS